MRPCPAPLLLTLIALAPQSAYAQASPDRFLENAARFLASHGYRNDPGAGPELFRIIESHAPTYVPELGTNGPRLIMGIERTCPDTLGSKSTCVRIDMLEVYAGQSTAQRGVIPLTFAGPRGGAVTEREPSSEVLADAEYAARALHSIVHLPPPPFQPPPPAEAPNASSGPTRRVPFAQGSWLWMYHELRALGYDPIPPPLLDTLRTWTGSTLAQEPGLYQHFVMARRSPKCPSGSPKGCRRLEVLVVRLHADTLADTLAVSAAGFGVLRLGSDSIQQVPPLKATSDAIATLLIRFEADRKARPYTDE